MLRRFRFTGFRESLWLLGDLRVNLNEVRTPEPPPPARPPKSKPGTEHLSFNLGFETLNPNPKP